MPLYYFQLRTRDAAPHRALSRTLPNLAAALAEAQHAARSMMRKRERHLLGAPSGSLDIEDEQRQPVARIMLAEVAQQIS